MKPSSVAAAVVSVTVSSLLVLACSAEPPASTEQEASALRCARAALAAADAGDAGPAIPADCTTTKTATYCGCVWNWPVGPRWEDPTSITELGCNTPSQGMTGTPYYKKPPPPPPQCICPTFAGEVITRNDCPATDLNACSGSGCTVRQADGTLDGRGCEYPPGYPKSTPGPIGTAAAE